MKASHFFDNRFFIFDKMHIFSDEVVIIVHLNAISKDIDFKF